jgi:uncharacterized protein GlcG (DUF336 family)
VCDFDQEEFMKISKLLVLALCAAALPATMMAQGFSISALRGLLADPNGGNTCNTLPNYNQLKSALDKAVADESTGLNLDMWGTIVDRDGVVCAVAFSGADRGSQWPGSRVISAQKANTANAFSLDKLSLSTANLYSATQPGGSLFGLQESNPVSTAVAYQGPSGNYGKPSDPMIGSKIGGVNVFGGGLALYSTARKVIGAVGVSGDTSCADHRIGWRVRNYLSLDNLLGVGGVSGDAARPDNMVFDIAPNINGGTGKSAGGFGHPTCSANDGQPNTLPAVH